MSILKIHLTKGKYLVRMPSGFGSIVKLSGNRRKPWAVRVTVGWEGNKQIRKYVSYHAEKREAITALADYGRNPYDVETQKITFKEVYEMFIKDVEPTATKTMLNSYRIGFDHLKSLYDMRIVDVKLVHMQGIINNMTQGHSTKGQVKTVCRKVFNHAIKYDFLDKDPSEYIEIGKKETKSKKTVFTEKEIQDIWDKVDTDPTYEIIIILLYTGLRVNELLEIEQVNVFDDHMIGGNKTEAGKNRVIPLHDKIRPFIEKRLDGSKYLLDNGKGGHYSYSQFHHAFNKLISGHTVHETRHTFISRMHSAGVNEITLKIIVGHAMNDITSRVYIHKEKAELVEAVNKLV